MKKIYLIAFMLLVSFMTKAQFPAPYCAEAYGTSVEPITSVVFNTISNTSSATVGGTAHEDFTSISTSVTQGGTYSITLKGNSDGSYTNYYRVFVDWNQDGDFLDTGESYNIGTITNSTGTDALSVTGSIVVPVTATTGSTRMRIGKKYGSYQSPCNTAGYGQAEDYTLNVVAATGCSGTPTAGTASGPTQACSGQAISLSLSGNSIATGITFQWQSTNTGGSSWTNISGATSANVSVNQPNVGTDYRCVVTCTNSSASANSTTVAVALQTTNCPPVNDLVCNATTLVLDGASDCQNTTYATSTGDPSFANSTPNNTIWYKYTPTTTGVVNFIMTRPSGVTTGLLYGWLGVYTATGTCPTLSFTETTSNLQFDLTTQTSVTLVSPTLTAGTTYYFMIDGYSGAFGAFCMQMITPPAAPANDDCASAVTISGYSGTTSGTNVSATQTSAPEACAGFTSSAANDVWYKFTALTNGNATVTVVGGTGFDAVVIVYSGTCGAFTSIGCADATGSAGTETVALTGLTAGTTYYLRVYGYGTSTGTFTISASGAALPVSLISITGERKNNTNVISWATATETNNAGFELQRSADGINFNKIAFINSLSTNGNSNQQLNYSYVDTKPFSASGYYRLKQMDKDGRSYLSNVVIVKGIKPSKLELSSVFPNPATSEISVSVISPKNDNVTFIVYDVTGKVISKYNRSINNGDNLLKLDISNLAVGNYTIKATCADGCETALSKFVKL